MADLLTHVLVAYVLATLLSLRDERVTPAAVTLAMVGAAVPDFNRLDLLVSDEAIATELGLPFSWKALLTVGGVAVVLIIGTLLVAPRYRRQLAAMGGLGAASHFALDYLLLFPSGYTHPYLWPLTDHALPGPNFYVSSARWPAAVAVVIATLIAVVHRQDD
ncbi:metal-dependent hydrolase [Haloplanus halobius]|uniref:metal-dependent hydrolase n=1 Tax=Haloplanus halobius TaxID=2934938 RepID=UPI00200E6649|nr:metal-dependent hydrolase [Haloplanus sp. XH21]